MTKRPIEGATIKITEVYWPATSKQPLGTLHPGDRVEVARDDNYPKIGYEDYTWVQGKGYPGTGSKYGWVKWEYEQPKRGDKIRITRADVWTMGLKVGDEIVVGCVCVDDAGTALRGPDDGLIWVTTGDLQQGQSGHRYGWIDFEPVIPKKVEAVSSFTLFVNGQEIGKCAPVDLCLGLDPAAEEEEDELQRLKSLCGRQRKELRRLNAAQRLAKLERDAALRAVEDLTQNVLDSRKALRLAETELRALDS